MVETQATCCTEGEGSAGGRETTLAPSCPMASMCREFTESRGARYGSLVLGALFIFLGVAISLEPDLLVWLAGSTTILLGLLVLVGGFSVRRFGGRLECCEPHGLQGRD